MNNAIVLQVPSDCQANRIFTKFGGVPALYRALQRLPEKHHRGLPALYRWLYPRGDKGGTGGIVPSSAQEAVAMAARLEGIFLTSDDWSPSRPV